MDTQPVTIIIGAAGGIGQALTEILSQQGHAIIAAGRHADHLSKLEGQVASTHQVDASNFEQLANLFSDVADKQGPITGVANLAGSILLKPAHQVTEAEFEETMKLNAWTAFASIRAAAKTMKQGGSVVLLSSVAARVGLANHEAIAGAKAAVIGMAQSAAASYARRNLRFNVIAPGLVDTPLAKPITSNEKAKQASEKMHPLGRLGQPKDIARAISFLLEPGNDWMTGQTFGIDGGISTVRTPA